MSIKIQMINLGHAESNIILMDDKDGNQFNLLVDGGSEKGMRDAEGKAISKKAVVDVIQKHEIHGIIVSHIDDDHIGGIINIMGNFYPDVRDKLKIVFVIFNKYISHMISFKQGSRLENLIKQRLGEHIIISSYQSKYIEDNKNILKRINNMGGIITTEILSLQSRKMIKRLNENAVYITILTPGQDDLNNFMRHWKEYIRNGKKSNNGEIINDSSIAVLVEYERKKVILSGDASLYKISKTIDAIDPKMRIEGLKLCHHGAYKNNVGIEAFIQQHNCKYIFYSSNGLKYEGHPDIGIIHNMINQHPTSVLFATNRITAKCIRKQIESCLDNLGTGSYLYFDGQNMQILGNSEAVETIDREKLADALKEIIFDAPGKKRIEQVVKKYLGNVQSVPVCIEKEELVNKLTELLKEEFTKNINVQREGQSIAIHEI